VTARHGHGDGGLFKKRSLNVIRITSKKEGFRRCGMAHSKAAVEYTSGKFTPEELDALKAEPMLVVEDIPDPEFMKDPGKDTKKTGSKSGKAEGGNAG
jgi:hypothetical protein